VRRDGLCWFSGRALVHCPRSGLCPPVSLRGRTARFPARAHEVPGFRQDLGYARPNSGQSVRDFLARLPKRRGPCRLGAPQQAPGVLPDSGRRLCALEIEIFRRLTVSSANCLTHLLHLFRPPGRPLESGLDLSSHRPELPVSGSILSCRRFRPGASERRLTRLGAVRSSLPCVSPDFSQAGRGLFAIRFRRTACAGSFDSPASRDRSGLILSGGGVSRRSRSPQGAFLTRG